MHIKAVADLLGHSSIAITGDVYGHTTDDIGASRGRRMERGARTVKQDSRCATYCATYPREVSDIELLPATFRPTTCAFSVSG